MAAPVVFLACPSYGQVEWEMAVSVMHAAPGIDVHVHGGQHSLLPYNFNRLWALALNQRQAWGLTHFAMQHADVVPEPGWLATLLEAQQQQGVDVLSVVLPIKDARGLTSTGLFEQSRHTARRFSLHEVRALPAVFTQEQVAEGEQTLLVNTGLWVCDFTQPWVERICFRLQDVIMKNAAGAFEARTFPEDWGFSLQCATLGLKVAATTLVKAAHIGPSAFRNDQVWGTCATDPGGR